MVLLGTDAAFCPVSAMSSGGEILKGDLLIV
jgi:hypothetical protein